MFLKELSKPLYQALFMELAALITMAEGEEEYDPNDINPDYSTIISLMQGISEDEFTMLEAYRNEFSSSQLDDFLNNSYISANKQFDLPIKGYNLELEEQYIESIENLEEGYYPTLYEVIKYAAQLTLDKYKEDKAIRQEVLNRLVENGEDILTLTPEIIQRVMVGLPRIRQEILEKSAQIVIESKEDEFNDLTIRAEKIIIFELIGTCFSSGQFEPEERQLLEKICDYMNVDKEYIDEFTEVMGKLFAANREAAELINE